MSHLITLNHEIILAREFDKKFDEIKECIVLDYTRNGNQNNNPKINQTIFAYDSETSNYIDEDGNKKPFVFSLMLTVMNPYTHKNVNILSRTIDEYQTVVKKITKYIGCKVNRKPMTNKDGIVTDLFGQVMYDESNDYYIEIFVHNLPFDESFLISHQNVYKSFSQSSHKPYYVITNEGVKYADTVVLTQKTLAEIGNGLEHFADKKQVGDFEYELIRNSKTKFSKKEKGYVTADTTVLASFINEEMAQWNGHIADIPMTSTGIVRRYCKNTMRGRVSELRELDENGVLPKSSKLHQILQDKNAKASDIKSEGIKYVGNSGSELKLTWKLYKLMKACYAGGFTHSNPKHTNEVLQNLQSWDFTSSYPTRILSEMFVANSGGLIMDTQENLRKMIDDCKEDEYYIFYVSFDEIYSKIDFDYYLSESKCTYDKESFLDSNGRIIHAKHVHTAMTSTDWDTFRQCYDFTNPVFSSVYKFKQTYLPRGLIMDTLLFYKQKTELKGIASRKRDYMRGKMKLNSIYGMMVQDPIKDFVTYDNDNGWGTMKVEDFSDELKRKLINEYNESNSRVLYYLWGVQISSYSRHELWRGILECKDDYVYSDTDSIKVLNADRHKKFIDDYNKEITDKITKCLKANGLDPELACPKDLKKKKHQLGVWDPNDGFYSYFKTLGAKRYIVVDKATNEFEITIAGLSKFKGAEYLLDKSKLGYDKKSHVLAHPTDKNIKKLFAEFSDKMYVPAERTGKLAHFYVDQYDEFKVKDYQGNEDTIPAGSGCLLKATDFTLSLSDKFRDFLSQLQDGYIEESTIIKNVL